MANSLNKDGGSVLLAISKRNRELETNIETFSESKIEADGLPEGATQAESKRDIELQTNSEPSSEMKAESNPVIFPDIAMELKTVIETKSKKQKMTDRKKRVSYYFDPETVKMVEKLANKTGWDKYEIVEAAVRDLYQKVFDN